MAKKNLKKIDLYIETSLKWLTVAMPFLETRERLERKTRERERLARDGAMADGLT